MTNRTGVLIRKIQALFAFKSCSLMEVKSMDAETIRNIQAKLDEKGIEATEEICKRLYGGSRMVTVADVLEKLGFDVGFARYGMPDNERYAMYNSGWVLDDNDNAIKFISAE